MAEEHPQAATVVDPELPGPFGVGDYARVLQRELRKRKRVLLIGEVSGFRLTRVQAYFELRDGDGAVPCAMWRNELERLEVSEAALKDGAEVVIGGGPDYYPGGPQASPSFHFRASHLRLAGAGDLLARLAALRERLRLEGLFELQPQLPRSRLPMTIGVVTAESGAARQDLLAGLERRGWRGTVIWGFAPVQDRHAAPKITAAMQDLAARPEVEAIVVCRGGGSLADLWAFCDETLCRTVAMLRIPVISAVGHERDRTLIDDVAAESCSTPTHAAEAAVPIDCHEARASIARCGGVLERTAQGAIGGRARHLAALARGPDRALGRERTKLNQIAREMRAASERRVAERVGFHRRLAMVVLERARRRGLAEVGGAAGANARFAAGLERVAGTSLGRRSEALERSARLLRAHDPDRTLERGYALVEEPASGDPLTSAGAAEAASEVTLRFADGRLSAAVTGRLKDKEEEEGSGNE